jgi:hypothetical protein
VVENKVVVFEGEFLIIVKQLVEGFTLVCQLVVCGFDFGL